MLPAADNATPPDADTATVPAASGNVIVLSAVTEPASRVTSLPSA